MSCFRTDPHVSHCNSIHTFFIHCASYVHVCDVIVDQCTRGPPHSIPVKVKSYAEYLMGVYKRSQRGEQWPPVKIHHYINLWTVSEMKDLSQESEDMLTKALIHGEIEKIKKVKKPIGIEQVCAHMMWIHGRQFN